MPDELEQEILGEDKRIKVDERDLKEKFRQWVEPLIVVLLLLLLAIAGPLLVVSLDIREEQNTSQGERDRGSANVCRFMQALGIDAGRSDVEPNNRCNDPAVRAIWTQYEGEITRSSATTGELMTIICQFLDSSENVPILPAGCEGHLG